ncbi:MAG: hypothetical protein JWM11_3664 [Planctomycetaceae bacterium]|nr:hypothetical protein [Planctomycetaceae bacterium]
MVQVSQRRVQAYGRDRGRVAIDLGHASSRF